MNKFYLLVLLIITHYNCLKPMDVKTDNFYLLSIFTSSLREENKKLQSTSPVPGNGGNFSVTKLSSNSIEFSWKEAESNITSKNNLVYIIYYSLYDNINSLQDIQNNGIKVASLKNQFQFELNNLKKSTNYFINLIVQDEKVQQSIYLSQKIQTNDDHIFFFSGSLHNGNLGGRIGVDKICQDNFNNHYQNSIECNNIHGFISITVDDEIRDFPVNYKLPVNGPVWGISILDFSQTLIAENFTHLLLTDSFSLYSSLDQAQVFMNPLQYYWSGSLSKGEVIEAYTCDQFSNSNQEVNGFVGTSNLLKDWINGAANYCNIETSVLCICY